MSSREKVAMTAGAPVSAASFRGHGLHADVIGDMPLEFRRRQAELAILGRQIAASVVGEQHQAAPRRAPSMISNGWQTAMWGHGGGGTGWIGGERLPLFHDARRRRNAVLWSILRRKSPFGHRGGDRRAAEIR
jgi:hypothetical protein